MPPPEPLPNRSSSTAPALPCTPDTNPEKDAWVTAFFIENHLDHYSYPEMVATPEQVNFMVYPEEDMRYYPCSDRMFEAIIRRKSPVFLKKKYDEVLRKILALITNKIEDKYEKNYLMALVKIKFKHENRDDIMIPSRIEKRLLTIFINRTQIEDPWMNEKALRNLRADAALRSESFSRALNHFESSDLPGSINTLTKMKGTIEHLEITRLFSLMAERSIWESEAVADYKKKDFINIFKHVVKGNGVSRLFNFLGIHRTKNSTKAIPGKKILWITNEAGEVMIDIAIISYLVKLGHKVIVVFKEGPLYTKVDFCDAQDDPVLNRELEGAYFITEKNLVKNDLVKILRSDNSIFAISDGTRERLNLLLTTKTFARIFKEVDTVISRGADQKRRFFDTHFQFTQDIYNISEGINKTVSITCKPRHPAVLKFSHTDLENKAKSIIQQMEDSKQKGMTVIFYSAIIGSIPGKIDIAKKIISVFIQTLKEKFSQTFIINPSEYYESGMDADDLMYMWEIVQSSGLIDIWRFQTYEDIVQSFQIMDQKVPPEWVGKDATYSTGCTKEMKIAIEVQKLQPEMQIIGPSKEKFMRRNEYGIGKMYDKRLPDPSQ